jgi:hypothetical protein
MLSFKEFIVENFNKQLEGYYASIKTLKQKLETSNDKESIEINDTIEKIEAKIHTLANK